MLFRILLYTLTGLLIVGLGTFAVNQVFLYNYNTQLLAGPCSLCAELNPHLLQCFQEASIIREENPNVKKINYSNTIAEYAESFSNTQE